MKLVIIRKKDAELLKEWVDNPIIQKELGATNDYPHTDKIFDEWFKGLVFYIENQSKIKIGFVYIQIIPEKDNKFSGIFHAFLLKKYRTVENGLEILKKCKEKCLLDLKFEKAYTYANARVSRYYDRKKSGMKNEHKSFRNHNLYSCEVI